MGSRPGEQIGIIYGHVEATEFQFAASDPNVKRLDYISAEHPSGLALGQVVDIQRRSQLSFEEAVSLPKGGTVAGDYVSCKVRIIGTRDERGILQTPKAPFKAGTEVRRATPNLIARVLGIASDPDKGAYLGYLKGTESPVVLDINNLVQKHVSVLARTGAGKSYTVGALIEELLKKRVPILVIDPHGEYTTLSSPNIEPREIDLLIKFNLKPKSFVGFVHEYVLEKASPGKKRLELEGTGLEAREIIDLLPGKVSPAQSGLLYQAVNEIRKIKSDYTFKEIIDEVQKNPSNAKWPLVGALETLEATKLFSEKGTAVDDLVVAGNCTIINLKGTAPEIQETCVARLANSLFEARKKNKVPPFMFVVEEAHNYCPQSGASGGTALSTDVLRTIAKEGRKFGMGLLIVSQRPANVDKTVLSQCNTQIIMKVTNPNDLKAITASVEGLTADTADEIQRLDVGVAMVAGAQLAQPVLVEVRTRQTKHGGRSVDVLGNEPEPEPEPAPEPVVRTLPPSPVRIDELPKVEHILREAHEAPPEVAEAPLVTEPQMGRPKPAQRPWGPEETSQPPLVDGELIDEPEPIRPIPPRPPVALPKRDPSDVPAASLVRPEAPEMEDDDRDHRLRPSLEPDDVLVQRVLIRVGYQASSTREAMGKVRDLAKGLPEMSPDDYVRGFAKIGRNYCYPSHPECGPCPLLRTCRLGMDRLGRGEVHEGRWGRKRR